MSNPLFFHSPLFVHLHTTQLQSASLLQSGALHGEGIASSAATGGAQGNKGGEGVVAAPGGAGTPPPGCGGGALTQLPIMFIMFGAIYFLMLRPQQKKQKAHDAMLKALDKGDMVRTSGGIRGEIVGIEDNEVRVMIADKVKINVLRSNIAGRINDGSDQKELG